MKKRIAINSFSNVSAHFVRMFISIFMTPYLLSKLGKEVYSILPLINSIVAFLILSSGGIQSSVGRYATLNFARGNDKEANRYINTAFFILIVLFCIVMIPFIIAVLYLPELLSLPKNHEIEAQIVFLLLGINLFVSMLFAPFTIGLYFRQRYELKNVISIAGQLLYVLFVICAFEFFEPNIVFAALATLINTMISSFSSILISKRLVPTIKLSFFNFDRTKIAEITSYSLWTLLISATVLIFLNTDYIIINKCIGASSVTDYSLAARFNEMLRAIIISAVTVIAPACTQIEADGAFDKLRSIFKRGLRITILLIIPPSLLLCVFSKELLITWVGHDFASVSYLFWIILLPQVFILSATPSQAILRGLGKVKWIGIANAIGALINLLLSLSFVIFFDMGVMGVALASSLVLSLKNLLFVPFYTSYIVKEPVSSYFIAFIKPFISALPMLFLAIYLHISFDIIGWLKLMSSSALCVIVFGVSAYFIAFEESDVEDCKEIVKSTMSMFRPIVDR